jgi:hypothetical protein
MTQLHPLLAAIDCEGMTLLEPYRKWLTNWREQLEDSIEHEELSMSACVTGAICELALNARLQTDWMGLLDKYLGADIHPLAYSSGFVSKLHNFTAQGMQSTLSAIFSRWWIAQASDVEPDHDKFADLVASRLQPDGHFYDYEISETTLRHRMKFELTLNSTYATQILLAANRIDETFALRIAASLTNTRDIPSLAYLSTEYFRYKTLSQLGLDHLFPVGFADFVQSLTAGLDIGWSDFDLASKTDAYMGTRKRTGRDSIIHSPLIANYVHEMRALVDDPTALSAIELRLREYALALRDQPLEIPSFQMRDLTIPFGTGISVLESVTASHLATTF